MPKAGRSAGQVDTVKQNILDKALKLMFNDGFDALSMRKLANQLGMTAANIYNYYTSKDELYLAIQIQGFRILAEKLKAISTLPHSTEIKMRSYMWAYIHFGIENPDYYEIMFCRNTPKYSDYQNTSMEPSAALQRQTAIDVADIPIQTIMENNSPAQVTSIDEARYITIVIWSTLHGILSLYTSRVLQGLSDNTDQFMGRLIDDLIKHFIETDEKTSS
ncbi:MAG: TetR/AcrR family transcriptional regulator [Proteobacteria bacterium]|nr:TetR/AcrR family transcriptional regulator [Pseudomonadota bacterium]